MKSLIATLLLLLASCSERGITPGNTAGQAAVISNIAELLANPSAYHGKTVRIGGPAVGLFEVSYICDDLPTMQRGRTKECLWIDSGLAHYAEYDGKIVEMTGRFDKDSQGHMGSYGASITPSKINPIGDHTFSAAPPPPEPH